MKILVQYPTRSRPELFKKVLPTWSNPLVDIHVVIDNDDPTMASVEVLEYLVGLRQRHWTDCIEPAGKHGAMNYGLSDADWDIVVLAQDDMVPVGDYAQTILNIWQAHFGTSTDGVLHPSDGLRRDALNTVVIMGREYYNRFGYIYHPDYKGLWADNEYTDVSTAMLKSLRVKDVILRHSWIGHTAPDELLKRNEAFFDRDKETYLLRKAMGFPKESVYA